MITGLAPGPVKILVETKSLKKSVTKASGPHQLFPPPGAASPNYTPPTNEDKSKLYIEIPGDYEDEKTTPLNYTMERGEKKYDIELK